MKRILIAFVLLSMILNLSFDQVIKAEQEDPMFSQLPVCLKPEQPLDQQYIEENIELFKKAITNHKLQVFKALVWLKLLVEKSEKAAKDCDKMIANTQRVLKNGKIVYKKLTPAQTALQQYIKQIQEFDETFRPIFYSYMKDTVVAYNVLRLMEDKDHTIDQEDIGFISRTIERLSKDKDLIMVYIVIVESKQKSLDKLVDDVQKEVSVA